MKRLLIAALIMTGCSTTNLTGNLIDNRTIKTATLDGRKSFDPDGRIVSQRWRQISGNGTIISPNSLVTLVKVKTSGTYELTVWDNDGATGKDTMTIIR
jgi:hypothetical protein